MDYKKRSYNTEQGEDVLR